LKNSFAEIKKVLYLHSSCTAAFRGSQSFRSVYARFSAAPDCFASRWGWWWILRRPDWEWQPKRHYPVAS